MRPILIAILSCSVWGCQKQEPTHSQPTESHPAQGQAAEAAAAAKSAAKNKKQAYSLRVEPGPSSAPGEQASAAVILAPLAPYKVNLEYPLKLTLKAPGGATPAERVLTAKEAAVYGKDLVRLEPSFALAEAGEHRISGELRFSVCTETQCELATEAVSWIAKVQ